MQNIKIKTCKKKKKVGVTWSKAILFNIITLQN